MAKSKPAPAKDSSGPRVSPAFYLLRQFVINAAAKAGMPTAEIAARLDVNRSFIIRQTRIALEASTPAELKIAKLADEYENNLKRAGLSGLLNGQDIHITLAGGERPKLGSLAERRAKAKDAPKAAAKPAKAKAAPKAPKAAAKPAKAAAKPAKAAAKPAKAAAKPAKAAAPLAKALKAGGKIAKAVKTSAPAKTPPQPKNPPAPRTPKAAKPKAAPKAEAQAEVDTTPYQGDSQGPAQEAPDRSPPPAPAPAVPVTPPSPSTPLNTSEDPVISGIFQGS